MKLPQENKIRHLTCQLPLTSTSVTDSSSHSLLTTGSDHFLYPSINSLELFTGSEKIRENMDRGRDRRYVIVEASDLALSKCDVQLWDSRVPAGHIAILTRKLIFRANISENPGTTIEWLARLIDPPTEHGLPQEVTLTVALDPLLVGDVHLPTLTHMHLDLDLVAHEADRLAVAQEALLTGEEIEEDTEDDQDRLSAPTRHVENLSLDLHHRELDVTRGHLHR